MTKKPPTKRVLYGLSLLVIILIAGYGIYAWVEFPVNEVVIVVDYNEIEPTTVRPVWNTLNVWDVSFLNGDFSSYNASTYRQRHFYVDHINIMTATGGRSTKTNEYYSEDAEGNPHYNFSVLLKATEWVLAADLNATIVIGNTPLQMSDTPIAPGEFDANTGIPRDYAKYYDYITNLTHTVADHLGSNLSRFHWRIYTEPDNEGWLRKGLENYFQIYITSFRAIRAVIPTAVIELGNMMRSDPEDALIPFIQRLQSEANDTLPNIVGYSGYGGGQFGSDERDIGESGKKWHQALENTLKLYGIKVTIEEGQILSDSNGTRLWDGDGTEFGAAWNAGVFHECILNKIEWYAQWSFFASEVRSPSLNVIEMFEKIQDNRMVNTEVEYPFWAKPEQRRLNGFGSLREDNSKGNFLLYFTDPDHFSTKEYRVKIQLKNIPAGWHLTQPTLYVVDHNHSNFFWDQYTVFGQYPRGNFAGRTSIWDLNVGISLNGTGHESDWYTWSWNHRNNYMLETIPSPIFSLKEGVWETELQYHANSVYLWEF